MLITSSVNHLFANKGFRPDFGFRIHSLSASYTKVQQNPHSYLLSPEILTLPATQLANSLSTQRCATLQYGTLKETKHWSEEPLLIISNGGCAMSVSHTVGVFCLCVMQAYSADHRLRICNDSNAEIVPHVIYRHDDYAVAQWIAEAPRLLSSGKCLDVALSPTAEQGYIQIMQRLPDRDAWFFPAYTADKQHFEEVVTVDSSGWFRPTEIRVCLPQDSAPSANGAPPPPRKRALGASIAPPNSGLCARGNTVAMNIQFSLPAGKSATISIRESDFRFQTK